MAIPFLDTEQELCHELFCSEDRSPGITDPITDGEARVLYYLPTTLSAPEIADELSASVNTVRTHLRHIYAKLGAHRRNEVVHRARALGLLVPPSRA